MVVEDLIGSFSVIGKNQNESHSEYQGQLELSLDNAKRIVAKWQIGGSQEQHGSGFFKDNILVINFNYIGEEEFLLKGVVVYRCLTPNILEGFWSEKYGDPRFLGEERCFRIAAVDTIH